MTHSPSLLLRAAFTAASSASLLTGCITTGHPPKGAYLPLRYQSVPTKPQEGKITVVFEKDSPVKPEIEWRLFATGVTTKFRPVCVEGHGRIRDMPEGLYGVDFQWVGGGKNPVHCPPRPIESAMVRVFEKQRVTVPLTFK